MISATFAFSLPFFFKKIGNSNREYLIYKTQTAVADAKNERNKNLCITESIFYLENLLDSLPFVKVGGYRCVSNKNELVFLIYFSSIKKWYCVDTGGFSGYIQKEVKKNQYSCIS